MRLLVMAMGALFAVLVGAPAHAQQAPPEPEVLTEVYACRDIADDAQRLACYDGAVGALRAAQVQGSFAAVDREQVQTVERESFGFSIPSLTSLIPGLGGEQSATPDVELQVERVVERARGYHAFVMTNGQVWVQTQAARTSNIRPGMTITIRRGVMGSFFLASPHGGAAHRVRREE